MLMASHAPSCSNTQGVSLALALQACPIAWITGLAILLSEILRLLDVGLSQRVDFWRRAG